MEHADIRAISFTGGTATGKIVAATVKPLFKNLVRIVWKNATIVLKDAPLDEMMEGIVGPRLPIRTSLPCGSRLLVDASITERSERNSSLLEGIVVGDLQNETTVMGSVISKEHQRKVESYIDLGIEEGGVVLTGGKSCDAPCRRPGVSSVPPTYRFRRLEPRSEDRS